MDEQQLEQIIHDLELVRAKMRNLKLTDGKLSVVWRSTMQSVDIAKQSVSGFKRLVQLSKEIKYAGLN